MLRADTDGVIRLAPAAGSRELLAAEAAAAAAAATAACEAEELEAPAVPVLPVPAPTGRTGFHDLLVACAGEQSTRNVKSEDCSAEAHCALELQRRARS